MFEPENDIERLLMRASAEPSARPDFARALMDAEIVLVLVPEGGAPIKAGPDGNAVIPEGTQMMLPSAVRGEQRLIPFFTARSRAQAWYRGDHVAVPEKTRELFARYPGAPFVLNPGSDFGKDFTRGEVARMLAGDFDLSGPQTIVTQASQQVMLAHPNEIPTALIEALARELEAVKSIRGAWLMLAARSGEGEPGWMLGVDHKGNWQDVREAIGRAVVGDILGGRVLDAMPLDASQFSITLRSGIPVIAANGGSIH